jgi:hypothetical protein
MKNKLSSFSKRLIAFMSIGLSIQQADGHRWIYSSPSERYEWFDELLKKNGISINNKIYGGVVEAVKVVDEALMMCGVKGGLMEIYDDEYFENEEYSVFDCSVGNVKSRITKSKPGNGGIY